jgi:hypothetical protein
MRIRFRIALAILPSLVPLASCSRKAVAPRPPTLATPPNPAAPNPTAAGASSATSQIYSVGGEVSEPTLLEQPRPVFPERFRKVRLTQPIYIYEIVVSESGLVQSVTLLRGRLDTEPYVSIEGAFRAAIKQWRYKPATLRGLAVPVRLTVTATVEVR